jgi:putative ABC transport system ATP-binding protein
MKKLLEIKQINVLFKTGSGFIHALQDLSFTVEPGEFVTIMGSSGAGKTTLLNILGCLDKPTSGKYFLDGICINDLSTEGTAHFRNKKIGFLRKQSLIASASVLENVESALFQDGNIGLIERREKVMEALEIAGLADKSGSISAKLSNEQLHRLAIACALVNDPLLLLADELTGSLDIKSSYRIILLLQYLGKARGKTVILTTHEPDIALFSSRTIHLEDGKISKDYYNKTIARAIGGNAIRISRMVS